MRVGINALSITPKLTGGGTTYILELLNHISRMDSQNNYFLFIRKDSKHIFLPYQDDLRLVSIPMTPYLSIPFRIITELLFMPLLAWWYKLDVLFCPGDSIPIWSPCVSIMVIQNLLHLHRSDILPLYKRRNQSLLTIRIWFWYYEFITIYSALKADKIITVSENAKQEIVNILRIKGSKISVVYHGVDTHFKADTEKSSGDRESIASYSLNGDYILYVGAMAPHKNVENLILALYLLKKRYSISLQLVIAGGSHPNHISYLQSIADKLSVSGQLKFLGYIPNRQLPSLYRQAKVFVILSLCESFGLPIIEAMACGCPVICSDVSSLPEIAGDAATLVDPEDPLQVAEAIKLILEKDKYRNSMINMGLSRAKEFSWERAASQTISIIEQTNKNRQ
jgi:glycosyltransferase involved in cell wall biosynthesis